MSKPSFILHGDIAYSKPDRSLTCQKDGYLVVVDGLVKGVYPSLPKEYAGLPLHDHAGRLIVPGLSDLHVHAPQYGFRGNGMDLKLLEWLNTYTFPEEAKYQDLSYADKAYQIFADDLRKTFTTRACIFATLHKEATLALAKKLSSTGLIAYLGLVEMDRNSPDYLRFPSAKKALEDTEAYLKEIKDIPNIFPILTPRFTPSCTDELMEGLGEMKKKYHLPVQSHLDENPSEVAWVKELAPWSSSYADAYDRFGMLEDSIMAHCVYLNEEEKALLLSRGTYVAHCPDSNINLTSGIAPIKEYLGKGMHVGLGSDVAGGTHLNLFYQASLAIQMSKARVLYLGDKAPLNAEEAFYLATLGGGSFFGKVGSFLEDYEADILVLDDLKSYPSIKDLSILDRVERFLYFGEESALKEKYVAGHPIDLK